MRRDLPGDGPGPGAGRAGLATAAVVPLVTTDEPTPPRWRRLVPMVLLVTGGTAIGGITLVRILQQVGRDRVVVMEAPPVGSPGSDVVAALSAIDDAYIRSWVEALSSPELAGRDTPSRGLDQAQELVAAEFQRIGLLPVPRAVTVAALERPLTNASLRDYFLPFLSEAAFFSRVPYEVPDAARCQLEIVGGAAPLVLGQDYVPLARSSVEDSVFGGLAEGQIVFAGFGIDSRAHDYDDFDGLDLKGKVAVVLSGEPGGDGFAGRFQDANVTAEACLWNKLDALSREGAAGALVVERGAATGIVLGPNGAPAALEYRWTRAYWNPPTMDQVRGGLPTLRVTAALAEQLLGVAPEDLRASIEESGSPVRVHRPAVKSVRMRAATRRSHVQLRNVVAVLPGVPDGPLLVVGAHLDHIGVGPRGRVGRGADDNASGVAAMLSMAKAFMTPDGRRLLGGTTVVFCAFTGEEDGRVGSSAFVKAPPLSMERCVGMVNLDMVGRGTETAAVVLGLTESPELGAPFARALARGGHGLEQVQQVTSPSFFPRSDHFAFYEAGIPALFLFEEWPHLPGIYHTWRDVPEEVSALKVASVARLAALVAFELAR